MHRFLLHNGAIHETDVPLLSPGQTGFLNGWGVFSTLRIVDGVLFEYPRHYRRMLRDAALMRVPVLLAAPALERQLLMLAEANHAVNATLRVALVRNRGGAFEGAGIRRDADVVAFTADLADWGAGVKLYYVPNGRHAASPFAGTKVTSWSQNLTWYEDAHARGYDEVILLNEHGQVSECTSANLFVIRGSEVATPPLRSSGCLPGVTRALLLEEIRVPGLEIVERDLTPGELEAADQVFITSTTRGLLPVLEVEGRPMPRKPDALARLQTAFQDYVTRYVSAHTKDAEAVTG